MNLKNVNYTELFQYALEFVVLPLGVFFIGYFFGAFANGQWFNAAIATSSTISVPTPEWITGLILFGISMVMTAYSPCLRKRGLRIINSAIIGFDYAIWEGFLFFLVVMLNASFPYNTAITLLVIWVMIALGLRPIQVNAKYIRQMKEKEKEKTALEKLNVAVIDFD